LFFELVSNRFDLCFKIRDLAGWYLAVVNSVAKRLCLHLNLYRKRFCWNVIRDVDWGEHFKCNFFVLLWWFRRVIFARFSAFSQFGGEIGASSSTKGGVLRVMNIVVELNQ